MSDSPPPAEDRRPATITHEHVLDWFDSLSHIERSVASSVVDDDSFVKFYFALLKEEKISLTRDHSHLLFPKDYLVDMYYRSSDRKKKQQLNVNGNKGIGIKTPNHSNLEQSVAVVRGGQSKVNSSEGKAAGMNNVAIRNVLQSTVDSYCQSAIVNVTSKLLSVNSSGSEGRVKKSSAEPVPCDKSGAAFEKSFDIFNRWQRETYCSFLTGDSAKQFVDTILLDINILSDSKAFVKQLKFLTENKAFTRNFSEDEISNAKTNCNLIQDIAWLYSTSSGGEAKSFVTIYHIMVAKIEINIWDAFYKTLQHMKKRSIVTSVNQFLAHFRTNNKAILESSKKSESFLTIVNTDYYSGTNEQTSSLSIMTVTKSCLTCLPSWSVLMTLFCELEEICECLRSLSLHAHNQLFSHLINMDGGGAQVVTSEKSEKAVINKLIFLQIEKVVSVIPDMASFVQVAREIVARVKSSDQSTIFHAYQYADTIHAEPGEKKLATPEEGGEPALRMKQRIVDIKPNLTADSLKRRNKGVPIETQLFRPELGAEEAQGGGSVTEVLARTGEDASEEMLRFNRSLKKEISDLLSPTRSGNRNSSESTSSGNSDTSDNENMISGASEKKKGKKKCKKKKKKKKSATNLAEGGEAAKGCGEDKGSSKEEAEEEKSSEPSPSQTDANADPPAVNDCLSTNPYCEWEDDAEDFVMVSNRKTTRLINKSKGQLDNCKGTKSAPVSTTVPRKLKDVSTAVEATSVKVSKPPASITAPLSAAPVEAIKKVPSNTSNTSISNVGNGASNNSDDSSIRMSDDSNYSTKSNHSSSGAVASTPDVSIITGKSSSRTTTERQDTREPKDPPSSSEALAPPPTEASASTASMTKSKLKRANTVLEDKVDSKVTLLQRKLTKNIRTFNKVMSTRMEAHKLTQVGLHIQLRSMVLSLWPLAIVRIYGSCITGLALPSSDIDIVIQLTDRSDHVHNDFGDGKLSCMSDDEGWENGHSAVPNGVAAIGENNGILEQLLSDRSQLLQHNANMKYVDEPSVEKRRPSGGGSSKGSPPTGRAPSPVVAQCISKQEVVGGLFALVGHLYMQPWASHVNPIPTAQIPLIKLRVASGIMLSSPALQGMIMRVYSDQVHGHGNSEQEFGCLPKVFVPSSSSSNSVYATQQKKVLPESSGCGGDTSNNGTKASAATVEVGQTSALIESIKISPVPPPRQPMLPFHLAQDVNIAVDITFEAGEHKGISTCDLIQGHLRTRSPVLPMVVKVIKELLRQAGFNMPYDGGLSSYSIFLMVLAAYDLYFLEETKALSEGADSKTIKLTKAAQQTFISNKLNEGVLLLYFLKLYGHVFDASKHGIDIMSYKILHELTPEQRLQVGTSGWITDPLDRTKNVARPSFAFRQIQLLLAQCHEAFEWEISLSSKEFLLTGKDNDTDLIKMFIRY